MKALLIDGLNLVRRIYAAVPENQDEATHIGDVIRSSAGSLRRALNNHSPTHCVMVFEQSGHNWRHTLFPDYKKNRSPMPEALHNAMPDLEKEFDGIGVKCFSLDGYEADDVIATLACKIASHQGLALVLSTDRILCQLLSEQIKVYDHFSGEYLDEDKIRHKFFVDADKIPQVLALAGDNSLSIPGVKGVGIRTAAKLINQYDNLDGVLNSGNGIPGKLGENIASSKNEIALGLQLFTLKTDINLGINLNQYRFTPELDN